MNQKGLINTILIALVVVLAGALVYVSLSKKSAPTDEMQPSGSKNKPGAYVPTDKTLPTVASSAQPIVAVPSTSLPATCKSETGGLPVITSLSRGAGPIGTTLTVKGCNLGGFEGDLDLYFERADGRRVMLTDTFGSYEQSYGSIMKVIVREPCKKEEVVYGRYSGVPATCDYVEMTPGVYKVYTAPWGKISNASLFTITAQ